MKISDMAQKNDQELRQLAEAARGEVANLVIDYRTKQVTGVKSIAAAKKRLARALTLLREREIAETEKTND